MSQLSLLIVPTQAILGTFALEATTTSGPGGSVSFGTGSAPVGSLRAAGRGERVCNSVGPAASLGNAAEPGLVYFAQIGSQRVGQRPDISRSRCTTHKSVSAAPPAASRLLLFSGNATKKLQLDLHTDGAVA